ncbi:MAG TPA: hypothetical protein VFW33_11895, partial [Gemmataceae bacterium]|nr:hypothetical protein [Gemmataceae bacterium]
LYLVRAERSSVAQPAPPPAVQHAADAAAPQRDTLEVRQVVFVDQAGQRKESIRLAETGGLAFCDSAGRTRALFSTTADGDMGFNLFTPDGQQRVSLGVLKGGIGHVAVCDENRKHIAYLDSSGLTLNEGGRSRGQLLLVDGLAGLSILDPTGKSRIGVGMTAQGPTIDVSDEKGAVLFKKP